MFNKFLYFSSSFIILSIVQNSYAFTPYEGNKLYLSEHEFNSNNQTTKLAKATFLPDTKDDLGFSGKLFGISGDSGGFGSGDPCSSYTLSKCPAHGKCTTCPTSSNLYKLNSCTTGWKVSGNACIPAICSNVNSAYKSEIPQNSICTKVTSYGLTCYKDCRAVNCSGYTLNCSTFNVPNATGKAECPDCTAANSNCSTKLCKVTSCQSGYKIANNATTCQPLDDNCPTGYYKSCETGIETTVPPQLTEAGSSCYKCKPETPSCDTTSVYQNMDGRYTASSSQKAINLYGNNNVTIIPSSGLNLCYAGWTYSSGTAINGGSINVNGSLDLGAHGGQIQTQAVFNVPVTINGKIILHRNSMPIFNEGISGSYKCYNSSSQVISCPFSTSKCDSSSVYKNMNGAYSVSSSQKAINLYGNNNTTTIPSSGVTLCYAGWTFSSGATINGGSIVINGTLQLGIHGGGIKTTAVFNVPVKVNGRISLIAGSVPKFNKGISGNYVCYDKSNNIITCPF